MAEMQEKAEWTEAALSKPLDPSATIGLQNLISDLRQALLIEASNLSKGDEVSEEDLLRAYKRLEYPDKDSLPSADVQTIISRALRENRGLEWISYGMAIVFFLFGLALFGIGVANSDVGVRIGAFFGGSVVELMILVPFRLAVNSRRHNIALRMLGIILNRVHDPKRLAPLLKDTFLAVVLGKAPFHVVK